MPRYARITSSTNIYHIMVRGNERKEIFLDDDDRTRFLDTIQKMKGFNNYDIYAYCLMSNHAHLLIREGKDSIQRSMKRISVSYVYYFNKKYGRVGHLFQDRYRSEAVEEESYILSAARYIHNNPVKAGIAAKAEDYKWSSYRHYIGLDESREGFVQRSFLLSILSEKEKRAVELFREFTEQTIEDEFVDYEENITKATVKIDNTVNLKNEIVQILEEQGQSIECLKNCTDKKQRNNLIKEIKEDTGASVRELSRIMGISKDIIFRA